MDASLVGGHYSGAASRAPARHVCRKCSLPRQEKCRPNTCGVLFGLFGPFTQNSPFTVPTLPVNTIRDESLHTQYVLVRTGGFSPQKRKKKFEAYHMVVVSHGGIINLSVDRSSGNEGVSPGTHET